MVKNCQILTTGPLKEASLQEYMNMAEAAWRETDTAWNQVAKQEKNLTRAHSSRNLEKSNLEDSQNTKALKT